MNNRRLVELDLEQRGLMYPKADTLKIKALTSLDEIALVCKKTQTITLHAHAHTHTHTHSHTHIHTHTSTRSHINTHVHSLKHTHMIHTH